MGGLFRQHAALIPAAIALCVEKLSLSFSSRILLMKLNSDPLIRFTEHPSTAIRARITEGLE